MNNLPIEVCFNQSIIVGADVLLDEAEEAELADVISQLTNHWFPTEGAVHTPPDSTDVINLASLAFLAGRTFQTQFEEKGGTVPIYMDGETVTEFINYLKGR